MSVGGAIMMQNDDDHDVIAANYLQVFSEGNHPLRRDVQVYFYC